MSKTRVFIYGSCVSRDTFEHMDPEQFELIQYVARQSALSAYTRPVDSVTPPVLESRFQQRMITGDFTSSLRTLIPQAAESTDLLLVDLVDERLGVYLLPDGSVVTRSVELIESGAERSLPPGTQHIAFGTQKHFEYWSGAIAAVGELVRTSMPRAAVALLDVPWAEWSESGEPTPDSFGVTAAQANPVFRAYVQAAAAALGAEIIALDPSEVRSGPHHPWGDAPFHYAERVYIQVVRRLTGADGRTIWGPDKATASRRTTVEAPPASGGQEVAVTQKISLDQQLRAGFSVRDLVRTTWRLRRSTGTHVVEPIQFREDGTVWGNSHKTTWTVADGYLALTNGKNEVVTTFDRPVADNHGFRLEGLFEPEPEKNIIHVLEPTEFDWDKRKRSTGQTRSVLAKEIQRYRWEIGDHTFGKPTVKDPRSKALTVGKFTTFGNNVTLFVTNRRVDAVSIYPFNSLRDHWPSGDRFTPQHRADDPLVIGNDVRIGDNTIIMPGVTIGDGAVVMAGAVVVSNVRPYAIVTGAPAVETDLRFSAEEVRVLLSIRWWEWPDEEIDSFLPIMASGIAPFLKAVQHR